MGKSIKVFEVYGNMKIIKIYADQKIPKMEKSAACIGYFDGLHLGHQKLFEKVLTLSQTDNIKSACICFENDPWIIMHKSEDSSQLTPFSLRMKKLEAMGIDYCYLLHFDEKMRQLNSETFISHILEALNLKYLICGHDFHFAYQGKGNVDSLKNRQFTLHLVDEVVYQEEKISSSKIEMLIKAGKIELANAQLGYVYTLYGKVIHGNQVGRSILGFPTANLALEESYVLMKEGVYEGSVIYKQQEYLSMINVGHNPTMNERQDVSIEAHIIDFDEDIYGASIGVSFRRYLREEQRFDSIKALINQLNEDIKTVKKSKGK